MTIPESLKDKYIAIAFAVGLVILVTAFFIAYINLLDADSLLIIHLDIFKGADFFGDYYDVFGIIAIAGVVWLLNIALAHEFYFKERFLSYVLAYGTVLFMILILVAINVIITIN